MSLAMSSLSASFARLNAMSMFVVESTTTPFRMASAYSTFLNEGRKTNAHLIELVQDRDGKVIFRADKRDCRGCNGGFSGSIMPANVVVGQDAQKVARFVSQYAGTKAASAK